jgi:hypothetical protein
MSIKDEIRARYCDEPTINIARDLNIPINKVYGIANRMGLKKSKEYMKKNMPGMDNLIKHGAAFRFKKGNISHNKGVKMPDEIYQKVKHTMFKPGQEPHNTRPVGSIRIQEKKGDILYQYIKVSNQHWQLLHRYNWEQVNGKIPRGMVLRFKDGNTMNCEVNNIELLTKQENMMRNTMHQYPAEIKEVLKLKNKLNKLINGKEQNQ